MRKQWHPDCLHAEHRGRLAPVVCDFHRCGVRGRDIYEPGDCDGCPSRQPPPRQKEGESMPRVGFWDKIEPDSGRTYLDLARELRAGGASCAAIEKQLDGPVNSLAAKLKDWPPAAKPKKPATRAPQQAQAAVVNVEIEGSRAELGAAMAAGVEAAIDRSNLAEEEPLPVVLSRAGDPDMPDYYELMSFLEEMGLEKRWDLWRSAWRAARLRYEQAG